MARILFSILFGLLGMLWHTSYAQVGNLLMHEHVELLYLDSIYADPTFHTAVRPYRIDQIKGFAEKENSLNLYVDTRRYHWLYNKNWIEADAKVTKIKIKPIFSTEIGPIFTQAFDYENDRPQTFQEVQIGVGVQSDILKNLSVNANLVFKNWSAPKHLQSWIDSTEVIPQFGRYKNGDKYSYAGTNIIGEISYSPTEHFNIQVGRGKNFLGDGYRSLQLSDNAAPYNFVKVTADIWKIKYVYLLNMLSDINPYTENKYSPKYTATHFFSYNITKWLNFNFFETITQQGTDSVGNSGLDVNYLNPIAFFRPTEFNLGSPDNAMLGVGAKIRISPRYQLYGHLILDEFILSEMTADRGFWGNKYGIQLGAKTYRPFGVKGLYLQGEFNYVRPYTYSHDYPRDAYGNLHSPLAHPLGSNFTEYVGILRYHNKRFGFSAKIISAQKGLDTEGKNYGGDIYKDYETRTVPEETKIIVPNWEGENDFGHTHLQGLKTSIRYSEFKVYFILNHRMNFAVEAGVLFHNKKNEVEDLKYTYGFFGIKTYLFNNYLDL